jgi:excisionase family DNA binding protein
MTGTPEAASELLDIAQAAEFLKVSETSLRRWTNAGRLACVRVGGRRERRFRPKDLLAFLEQQPATDAFGATRPRRTAAPHDATVGGISVALGTHLVALYRKPEGRARQAARFLADAFRPGIVSFLVGGPRACASIVAHLERDRPSLRGEIERGQLVLSEYAHSKEEQWEYFETAFIAASRAGAQSFRVVGDASGLAPHTTPEELVAYEAGYERSLASRFPVVTLCQYDVRRFSARALVNALEGHQDNFRYPVEQLFD